MNELGLGVCPGGATQILPQSVLSGAAGVPSEENRVVFVFCVWPTLLSVVFLRFISAVVRVRMFIVQGWALFPRMAKPLLCIQPSLGGHLGGLHLFCSCD